jgi:hypothetical protein
MDRWCPGLTRTAVLFAVWAASSAFAASYYVDTAAQFNSRRDKNDLSFATLQAGDRVYLKGGSWEGLVATLTGSMTDAEAQSNPAVITACDVNYVPAAGQVTVTNLSAVTLAGSGLVIAGITFSATSGMLPTGTETDYNGSQGQIIECAPLSRYMTVSHLKFDHCGSLCTKTNAHYGPWVMLYGYHHTLQYCEFEGRDFNPNDINVTDNGYNRTSIRDATVKLYKDGNDTSDWGHHAVRYNYFGERQVPLDNDSRLYLPADGTPTATLGNGWESIRLGAGSLMPSLDLSITVEHNVFYHSVYPVTTNGVVDPNYDNGEPEIISNKSRNNRYRYNTFLNSYGQLCLRAGDYAVVQGNYFLAGGAYDAGGNIVLSETRNNRMGGVRVIGFGHTVANNYFYRLNGTKYNAALSLLQGTNHPGTLASLNNGESGGGYETANYSHILGNTFIDCNSLNLDCVASSATNAVYGTRFINNLIHYSGSGVSAGGITGQNTDALGNHGGLAHSNYVFYYSTAQRGSALTMLGTASNIITSSASQNPQLTNLYDVLTVPSATSPVIGAAAALPAVNDTSAEAGSYDLAGHVANYGSLDLRGLSRPAAGRDIGDYEVEVTGSGMRPLRRHEVGSGVTNFVRTAATVTLDSLGQTYNGVSRPVTATTTPSGLAVTLAYHGGSAAPTNAGSYAVAGTIVDWFYGGTTTGTLVIAKADATVTLGNLVQTWDGRARTATATTLPPGLAVTYTYNGSLVAPTNTGSYTVIGTVDDANYGGAATNTLLILAPAPTQATQLLLGAEGGLVISGTGPTGLTYRIVAATNLALPFSNWTALATGRFAGGVFNFTDSQTSNYSKRFYRLTVP